jgi:peptide/nickel transport system permease protein
LVSVVERAVAQRGGPSDGAIRAMRQAGGACEAAWVLGVGRNTIHARLDPRMAGRPDRCVVCRAFARKPGESRATRVGRGFRHSAAAGDDLDQKTLSELPLDANGTAELSGGARHRAQAVFSNLWVRFVLRRLLGLVCVLVVLVIAIFSAVRLIPGDPVRSVVGLDASAVVYNRVRNELGLEHSFLTQLGTYLSQLLFHGNLGTSFTSKQPVSQIITQNITPSAELAGLALAFVLIIGIPVGIAVASITRDNRHRRFDVAYQGVSQLFGTIPDFLLATALVFLFAVKIQLLPVAGSAGWKSLVLPVLSLAIPTTAILSRIVRAETRNVLAQDYMRTARGKRLPRRLLLFRHALPNVLTAALTVAGLLFAGLIGGAVIIENVFARPGLGTQLTNALLSEDYPTVQGITIVLGAVVVVVNGLVDVLLALIDKRSLARES